MLSGGLHHPRTLHERSTAHRMPKFQRASLDHSALTASHSTQVHLKDEARAKLIKWIRLACASILAANSARTWVQSRITYNARHERLPRAPGLQHPYARLQAKECPRQRQHKRGERHVWTKARPLRYSSPHIRREPTRPGVLRMPSNCATAGCSFERELLLTGNLAFVAVLAMPHHSAARSAARKRCTSVSN